MRRGRNAGRGSKIELLDDTELELSREGEE